MLGKTNQNMVLPLFVIKYDLPYDMLGENMALPLCMCF